MHRRRRHGRNERCMHGRGNLCHTAKDLHVGRSMVKVVVSDDLPKGLAIGDSPHGVLYKASDRQALAARREHWAVIRCAQDAQIDLTTWTLNTPARRQLRRALKAFSASRAIVRRPHDVGALTSVAETWTTLHGQEKGLSMGRYCPDYLSHQTVFAAYSAGRPIAFVSFHTTGGQWTLDVMRHGDDLPKGTMQALIVAAIDAARRCGVTRMSLAAVPAPAPHVPLADRTLARTKGLRRFKQAFAPTWRPLYLCARNRLHLVSAMAALAYGIHRPPPLPERAHPKSAQTNDEDYSFAPQA